MTFVADNTYGVTAYETITISVLPVTVPNAPTNPAAKAISMTQINLTWTDNSNNEDSFKILRKKITDASYTQIATVAANMTSYQNAGLTYNTTYSYIVKAYNSVGDSAGSAEAKAEGPVLFSQRQAGRLFLCQGRFGSVLRLALSSFPSLPAQLVAQALMPCRLANRRLLLRR